MNTLNIDYNTYKQVWKRIIESTASMKIIPIKEYYKVLTKVPIINSWSVNIDMVMKSGVKMTYDPIRYDIQMCIKRSRVNGR
jgi:hypothetical protein